MRLGRFHYVGYGHYVIRLGHMRRKFCMIEEAERSLVTESWQVRRAVTFGSIWPSQPLPRHRGCCKPRCDGACGPCCQHACVPALLVAGRAAPLRRRQARSCKPDADAGPVVASHESVTSAQPRERLNLLPLRHEASWRIRSKPREPLAVRSAFSNTVCVSPSAGGAETESVR